MYNKILGNSENLYTREVITLEKGIMDYINDNYRDNTLIIPLGGNGNIFFEGDQLSDIDSIPESMREDIEEKINSLPENLGDEKREIEIARIYRNMYDYRLVQLRYKASDRNFPLLNVKMLGSQDPRSMGLLSNVHLLVKWADEGIKKAYQFSEEIVGKIPFFIDPKFDFKTRLDEESKTEKIRIGEARILDRVAKFCQNSYDKYLEEKMIIWIPVWKVNEQDSIRISLFDRIDIIIS